MVIITGGGFQDSEGNPLANGYLVMSLNVDASTGTKQVSSAKQIRVPLDSNGNVSGTVNVWANDELTPNTTFYVVKGYTSAGLLVWGPQFQTILTTQTDLTAWVPNEG